MPTTSLPILVAVAGDAEAIQRAELQLTALIEAMGPKPWPCSPQPHGQSVLAWQCSNNDLALECAALLQSPVESAGLDVAAVSGNRLLQHHRVLAMDMDSTVINIECIDELADHAGKKAQVAEITEATMRGEIKDFSESLRRRVALLEGLAETAIAEVIQHRLRFNPGAPELLRAAKAAGMHTVLVSGGFTIFAQHVAQMLGFDEFHANTLEIVDGRLTGRVLGAIVDGEFKKTKVLEVCRSQGVDPNQAVAVGDGSNDLPMMGVVGLSVAYHAKPRVRSQARLAINHGRLDSPLLVGFEA